MGKGAVRTHWGRTRRCNAIKLIGDAGHCMANAWRVLEGNGRDLKKEKVKKRRLMMLVTLARVSVSKWLIDGMIETSRMKRSAEKVASRPSLSFDTPKIRANRHCRWVARAEVRLAETDCDGRLCDDMVAGHH
eukprot:3701618-Rhodomonas_salina.1